jgi:hypothetical protein
MTRKIRGAIRPRLSGLGVNWDQSIGEQMGQFKPSTPMRAVVSSQLGTIGGTAGVGALRGAIAGLGVAVLGGAYNKAKDIHQRGIFANYGALSKNNSPYGVTFSGMGNGTAR